MNSSPLPFRLKRYVQSNHHPLKRQVDVTDAFGMRNRTWTAISSNSNFALAMSRWIPLWNVRFAKVIRRNKERIVWFPHAECKAKIIGDYVGGIRRRSSRRGRDSMGGIMETIQGCWAQAYVEVHLFHLWCVGPADTREVSQLSFCRAWNDILYRIRSYHVGKQGIGEETGEEEERERRTGERASGEERKGEWSRKRRKWNRWNQGYPRLLHHSYYRF